MKKKRAFYSYFEVKWMDGYLIELGGGEKSLKYLD